jgi:isoprenylcysteine carboxyl methyltransferase (ICMT) family protein YpbQ
MNLSPRTKLRLLGVLPLIFFLAQSVHYWRTRELGNLMWMCNIGNLLLAMGLFLEKPVVVRLAAIWTVPGVQCSRTWAG